MFRNVQLRVRAAIGQEPWIGFSALGKVHLAGLAPEPPKLDSPPATQPARQSEAAEAWAVAERTSSVAALEASIRRYGDTYYGDLAKVRLRELKQAEVAKLAAEAARKKADEEARTKADAERQRVALLQQEEAKKRAEAEVARKRAETEATKPGRVFRDCADCPEMVVVPAGSFTMGSPPGEEGRSETEGPQRKVTIARPFAVGKFEVTFTEWDACVAAGGCKHNPNDQGWGRGGRPVIDVSWNDITREYLPWLSRKTGKTYRLLTEAEWEYAARAGTTTPFWWGSSISTSQANYHGPTTYGGGPKGEYRQKTVPVDSFAANLWGLYNVHGNVWEWVEDCWHMPIPVVPAQL
jgi:formylglycine-generating enzyme required for sulfatase activity